MAQATKRIHVSNEPDNFKWPSSIPVTSVIRALSGLVQNLQITVSYCIISNKNLLYVRNPPGGGGGGGAPMRETNVGVAQA